MKKVEKVVKGNFSDMGSRGRRSTEAQVLRTHPLTRSEIASHAVAGTTVTFFTKAGIPVSMSIADARKAGLVG